jgi:hypothetical protein
LDALGTGVAVDGRSAYVKTYIPHDRMVLARVLAYLPGTAD